MIDLTCSLGPSSAEEVVLQVLVPALAAVPNTSRHQVSASANNYNFYNRTTHPDHLQCDTADEPNPSIQFR